jgi:hypothetical protein
MAHDVRPVVDPDLVAPFGEARPKVLIKGLEAAVVGRDPPRPEKSDSHRLSLPSLTAQDGGHGVDAAPHGCVRSAALGCARPRSGEHLRVGLPESGRSRLTREPSRKSGPGLL